MSTSADSHGSAGVAAWRPSNAHGGERNADEVTAQTARHNSISVEPTKGRRTKATDETTTIPRIHPPKRARPARTRSIQKPVTTSMTANTAWSATRIQGTQRLSMPACAASCGR